MLNGVRTVFINPSCSCDRVVAWRRAVSRKDGRDHFEHACKLGLEGIVSKRRDHPYRSGPSKAWLKIKNPTAPGVLRFVDDGA
jgi:ATP-dependent DNA ligase